MVDAEQGLFGEMFDDNETFNVKYDFPANEFSKEAIELKIKQLGIENKKLLATYSRVVWYSSLAMSHWFHENKEAQAYLGEGKAQNILEFGTGTGLLGIYLGLKLK